MIDKAKRKVNPRRRTLIRLLLGIMIFAALISAGIYVLQPKSAQIVFIAPDDNGIDAIWIADLDNPEHPRQLTFHGQRLRQLQVSEQGKTILYMVESEANSNNNQLWYMNLSNAEHKQIPLVCDIEYECESFTLSPDGQWVSYQQASLVTDTNHEVITVYIYNISSGDTQFIYEQHYDGFASIYISPYPKWIGNTGLLAYRISGADEQYTEDEFVFYNVEENRVISSIITQQAMWTPTFSDDGSRYLYVSTYATQEGLPLIYSDMRFDTTIRGQFYDWHPGNERILVGEGREGLIPRGYYDEFGYELVLLNPITGERDVLISPYTEPLLGSVTFNYDGMQILYRKNYGSSTVYQLMLYDMETREEIALPLFGRNPHWVNGGRS